MPILPSLLPAKDAQVDSISWTQALNSPAHPIGHDSLPPIHNADWSSDMEGSSCVFLGGREEMSLGRIEY